MVQKRAFDYYDIRIKEDKGGCPLLLVVALLENRKQELYL